MPDRASVAVIVPAYNRAESILPTLEDVLQQRDVSGFDVGVYVVDDGSTDDTASIAESTGVTVIRKPNGGVASARNAGVAETQSDYVVFLDSDDRVTPYWLATLMHSARAHDADIVCCGWRKATPAGRTININVPRPLRAVHGGQPGATLAGTFLVRRSVFVEAGGYDESLNFCENSELWMRLAGPAAPRTPTVQVEHVIGMIWIDHDGPRSSQNLRNRLASLQRILERHPWMRTVDPVYASQLLSSAGLAAARCGERALATELMRDAAKLNPSPKAYARILAAGVGSRSWSFLGRLRTLARVS